MRLIDADALIQSTNNEEFKELISKAPNSTQEEVYKSQAKFLSDFLKYYHGTFNWIYRELEITSKSESSKELGEKEKMFLNTQYLTLAASLINDLGDNAKIVAKGILANEK